MRRAVRLAIVLCAAAGPAAAQGLGEAARKEHTRRAHTTETAKVYTLDDLDGRGAHAGSPVRAAESANGVQPVNVASPAARPWGGGRATADEATARVRQEAQWRNRVAGLRHRLDVMEREVAQRDGAANMSAYNGPVDCAGFVNTRHQWNLDRLQEARQGLSSARKALEDFEEEARRAGVPPGWLR